MTQTVHEKKSTNIVNGVEIDTVMEVVNAIVASPELGACHFRGSNEWLGGTRNQTSVYGFYAAGQEIDHEQPFGMMADEPPILSGSDFAATPAEHLLHALSSCVTTSVVAHAAIRGIEIERLESRVEGDLDLRGFFGLSNECQVGYSEIRMRFRVAGAALDTDQLMELTNFSPVLNTVRGSARVTIEFDQF